MINENIVIRKKNNISIKITSDVIAAALYPLLLAVSCNAQTISSSFKELGARVLLPYHIDLGYSVSR